jgi:hypothetical protein
LALEYRSVGEGENGGGEWGQQRHDRFSWRFRLFMCRAGRLAPPRSCFLSNAF